MNAHYEATPQDLRDYASDMAAEARELADLREWARLTLGCAPICCYCGAGQICLRCRVTAAAGTPLPAAADETVLEIDW